MNTILQKIQNGSSYNFQNYIDRYEDFLQNDFNILFDYWKTFRKDIPNKVIENFKYLYREYDNLLFSFKNSIPQNNYDMDFFDFAEFIGDIKTFLDYTKNLPKFLKTSENFVDVFEISHYNYFIKQGDTIESISNKFYGDSEMFSTIMDYNNIRYNEINNDQWIGKIIKVPLKKNLRRDVLGVIDVLVGERILGKDIDKKITFINDDLKTLQGKDCLLQGIDIMIENSKNTVPEFPTFGNLTKLIIGKSLGNISAQMIRNDLVSHLKNDSTIKKVDITDFNIEGDVLNIKFEFQSLIDEDFFELKKVI